MNDTGPLPTTSALTNFIQTSTQTIGIVVLLLFLGTLVYSVGRYIADKVEAGEPVLPAFVRGIVTDMRDQYTALPQDDEGATTGINAKADDPTTTTYNSDNRDSNATSALKGNRVGDSSGTAVDDDVAKIPSYQTSA